MKWFHHECSAKHDPRLQTLGALHGAEAWGVYWGLLEELGRSSDTFHLKVDGISAEVDRTFAEFRQSSAKLLQNDQTFPKNSADIPQLPCKILAKNLFVSPKKLRRILDTMAKLGLFDFRKWFTYHLLYSPAFERRADDYTRRRLRCSDNVRTHSGQCSNTVRTDSELCSESVTTEQETEQKQKEKKNTETEKDLFACLTSAGNKKNYEQLAGTTFLIDPSPEEFREYCTKFLSVIRSWNEGRAGPFLWHPTEGELRKLFCGGERIRKLALCYQAYNLQEGKVHYPELVLRALRLMLKASEKQRITNPFGWIWTSLHGNGEGTAPWAQLLSCEEESGTRSILTFVRHVQSPKQHKSGGIHVSVPHRI